MLYIKCTKDYLEYFDEKNMMADFFKKAIFIYRKIFKKVTKINTENGEVWLIPEKTEKFKNSLIKNLKIYQVKTVVLSNNILDFKQDLEAINIKVLDGKWLYRYLILDIVKYICQNTNKDIKENSISYVIQNPSDVDFENLQILSKYCKSVNLATKEEYKFKRLEEKLYEKDGVILNISYNYKKSFLKSDIIINLDLDEKEFNKFSLPRKAFVINLQKIAIQSKGFNGVNVLKYEIEFPNKYEDNILNLKSFNKEILYESYIYKKTAPQNIFRQIEQDKLVLTNLLGKNGYINKREYSKP